MKELKGKKVRVFDMVGYHPVDSRYDPEGDMFLVRDIEAAVELYRTEIRRLQKEGAELGTGLQGKYSYLEALETLDRVFADAIERKEEEKNEG